MYNKQYPIGGYASGNYNCTCCICSAIFMGDKRAVQCVACATGNNTEAKTLNDFMNEAAQQEGYQEFSDLEQQCGYNKSKLNIMVAAERYAQYMVVKAVGWQQGMPEFDGHFLCIVRIPQECGNVWIRQEVVYRHYAKWQAAADRIVTHWQPLPPYPIASGPGGQGTPEGG